MVRRYLSIAVVALLSILDSAGGAGLRSPDFSEDIEDEGYYPFSEDIEGEDYYPGGGNDDGPGPPDWVKAEMVVEKGFKCKAGADKKKMGAGRGCEGGFKQTVSAQLAAKDLAEDVVATGIMDLRSSMLSDDRKDFFPVPEEAMEELARWDSGELVVFEGEDCLEESGGCKKKVEFGGYAKVFWGCNITFSMKGKKVSKEVDCGGKSVEGAGVKKMNDIIDAVDPHPSDYSKDDKIVVSGFDVFSRREHLEMSSDSSDNIDNNRLDDGRDEKIIKGQAGMIWRRWKELEPKKREAYEKLAKAETMRYEAEMEIYDIAKPPADGLELSLLNM